MIVFVGRTLRDLLGAAALAALSARFAAAQETPAVHEHVVVDGAALTPTRDTSGTAWQPAVTPMSGLHRPWHGWDVRLDGAAFLQGVYEPGDRHRTGGAGTRQIDAVNWGMAMVRRAVGRGRVGVRTMLSAEPWTVPGCGTLNHLATGEVCDGDTIHDRQPPHDLVMELAADYERPLAGAWRGQLYAGLAGEPALGPPGYPHRASAAPNPVAPIGHHGLDGTHVTFGLVTAAVHDQRWKVEVSRFTSRAPDTRRTDLDLGVFDAVAARVSLLPTPRLALQVSAGRLREAATEFPTRAPAPEVRGTTSAMYHRPIGRASLWATTVAIGATRMHEVVSGRPLDATSVVALAESALTLADRHTLFGRAEVSRLPGHDLHATEYAREMLAPGKVQAGYVRQWLAGGMVTGVGGSLSLSLLPSALAPRYGGRVAPGGTLFVSVRPARHAMDR